ncbi:MAG TPA: hypothetical protein PK347_00800 [Burkholderiaceae bacterium]|nr:hypothetical protein [Burkholderiaceae bacterium]
MRTEHENIVPGGKGGQLRGVGGAEVEITDVSVRRHIGFQQFVVANSD